MASATLTPAPSLDWYRIGAWSGTVAAHLGVLLLIALPIAAPPIRHLPTTIEARWIETPPPPPEIAEPPPPAVPHRVLPTPVHPPPPTIPVAEPSTLSTTPVPNTDPTPTTVDTAPPTPSGDDIGTGGATQMLAYATPLTPRYPPASLRAHEQGTVLLRVLVDESGVPQRVEIARSSGHTRLDTAARDSVMHARFRPVMRNGSAAGAWGIVPIAFRLDAG
ncbi:MAG TPA: TonB family protein [Rhodanobacteraceae bacterium]|nr:TonB family protein [Rhodanobacteraceae bacterium]